MNRVPLHRRAIVALAVVGLLLTGCSSAATAATSTKVTATTFWNANAVHSIAITMAKADFTKVVADYRASQTKTWVKVTLKLDGRTFTNVGMRLKGNSSLRSISASATAESLPWLVRLDKYAKTQNLNGMTAFVVRSNTTATALNEAIALELIGAAGLATQRAIATKFSVNGSKPTLRLVIENMDDYWYARNFTGAGLLYKAEATGDYSYRGETATAYDNVFDQETSKGTPNLAPLTAFLKFINQSTDAEFAADLAKYLDVEKFAKYLAIQDLLDNFDDIEGPGNNSYLQFNASTGRMTVVNWDENLAFGQRPGAGGFTEGDRTAATGGLGQFPAGQAPTGQAPTGQIGQFPGVDTRTATAPPTGQFPTDGRRPPGFDTSTSGAPPQFGEAPNNGRGGFGKGNILAQRFRANTGFAKLITDASVALKAKLYTSGYADKVLTRWEALLKNQALTVVTTAKITSEAAAIRAYFTK